MALERKLSAEEFVAQNSMDHGRHSKLADNAAGFAGGKIENVLQDILAENKGTKKKQPHIEWVVVVSG